MECDYIEISLLAVNALLGLTCTVLLGLWCCMLWKRRLLKNKVKFVCTQIGHILLILVVFITWNILKLDFEYSLVVIRTFAPVSFDVYILISLQNMQNTKAQVPATNRHTNPPSTRVSLPTDTAEHAPKPKYSRTFRSDSANKLKTLIVKRRR